MIQLVQNLKIFIMFITIIYHPLIVILYISNVKLIDKDYNNYKFTYEIGM